MTITQYSPSYVWPKPAFPFRFYLDHPRLRIFIIENIQHNWSWLKDFSLKFRKTDFFFVYCGWYHSPEFALEADHLFTALNLDKTRFFFMFNSAREEENFRLHGFHGALINHNAWLDEDKVMRPLARPKRYDAIYVARRSAFKRHYLAAGIPNLALIAGRNHGNDVAPVPSHSFLNEKPLLPEAVCEKINESRCGLVLSASEGACFSSSEYLLCGIPVVSTPSLGGRDVWYNEYNSIICEPSVGAVAEAVIKFVDAPRDSERIRAEHIALAMMFRERFVRVLGETFSRFGVDDLSAEEFFCEHYFHKMRNSYRPDFAKIWP